MTEPQLSKKPFTLRIFGVGSAGLGVIEQLMGRDLPPTAFVAIDTDAAPLAASSAAEKLRLETPRLRGLGTGGDPGRGRILAHENAAKFKALSDGFDLIFIVTGLGGGAGTGISPALAKVARETGAVVLAFVKTPFECEGSLRKHLAQHGLEELKAAADGVICLPNEKIFKLVDENASVLESFKLTNDLLANGVRGIWRLLTHKGLLDIHFSDFCELVRDRHTESAFAVAEAAGPTRSRDVAEKLLAHPMLDGGQLLEESKAVLVSLLGGPDLSMAEVNRVMEQINAKAKRAQVILGAAIDPGFTDTLAVTLVAARKTPERPQPQPAVESLDTQLLERSATARPESRFVPPPPALPPEEVEKMLTRQHPSSGRGRKSSPRMKQTQLPLEIISKGRFDKSEPTIHKGEDLDVPTYIRRGVSLN